MAALGRFSDGSHAPVRCPVFRHHGVPSPAHGSDGGGVTFIPLGVGPASDTGGPRAHLHTLLRVALQVMFPGILTCKRRTPRSRLGSYVATELGEDC